jgi:phosphatidylserine/phosphatidylglycerophosphate/cardiolipin synthase-like enzyme
MPRIVPVKPNAILKSAGGPLIAPALPKPAAAPKADGFSTRAATASITTSRATAARTSYHLDVNAAYFPDLMKLIGNAKTSIDMVQYNFFSESGHSKELVDALIAKKKANPTLQIRLFIEGDHGDAAARNQLTMKALAAAGIQVVADSKNLVTHAKGVCVDSRYVLAGSHNLSNTSMNLNNETTLSFDSPPLAAAYEKYFAQLVADPGTLHPATTTAGKVTMLTDTACFDQLIHEVKTAKKSIDASMYYFNLSPKDPKATELANELVAAQKRGVHVRLFLEQGSGAFAPGITVANKKAAEFLKANGITDVHFDAPGQISHQKFLVRDGKEVLMGSSNWSTDDFDQRHQVNFKLKDPKLAKQLQDLLTTEIG